MPVFTSRKLRRPGRSASDETATIALSEMGVRKNQLSLGGLSKGELKEIITLGEEWMGRLDTPSAQASVRREISNLELTLAKMEAGALEDPKQLKAMKKDADLQAMYLAADRPADFLKGKKVNYDTVLRSYQESIDLGLQNDQVVTELIQEMDDLQHERDNIVSMMKVYEGRESGKMLNSMAYVITPDTAGNIADIKIIPATKVKGAFRTDAATNDGIPIYVTPNEVTPGGSRAVIGDLVFSEEVGTNRADLRALRDSLKAQGASFAEISEQIRTAAADPSRGKSFKLEGEGLAIGKTPLLDVTDFSVRPTVPIGDYGVGKDGVYKRKDDGRYIRIDDESVESLSLRPSQYRFIDSSQEQATKHMLDEVISAESLAPPQFKDTQRPQISPFSPKVIQERFAPEEPAEEGRPGPTIERAKDLPVRKSPTLKEPGMLGSIAGRAKRIFTGQFGGPTQA